MVGRTGPLVPHKIAAQQRCIFWPSVEAVYAVLRNLDFKTLLRFIYSFSERNFLNRIFLREVPHIVIDQNSIGFKSWP